jgi:multiple sugar transport system permease protein
MAQALTPKMRQPLNIRHALIKFPYIRFLILFVLSVVWAAPVLWMFVTSLKPEAQIITAPPRWLPQNLSDLTIDHYINVLQVPRGIYLPQAFMNSIFVSTVGTFLVVSVDVLAGYAFARMKFPGRDALFAVVVASLIVPIEILLIPNYITVWKFGWLQAHGPLDALSITIAGVQIGWFNVYNAVIFPALAGGFGVFLMRQFLLSLPREIEDAAEIDGCGRLRMLFAIVIPLSSGAIATLAIFTYIFFWNDFTWPYILISEASKMTLPVALIQFKGDYYSEYGRLMAGTAISALPAIIIFLLAQRMIIRSITLTGVKG